VNTPTPPPVPPIAPLTASELPEPQPPAPPAPPPPNEQLSPLSLTLAPPGIAIATPTAVIQPPTPPVNPAPPGGARREARQRQAAAQKSGADNEESSEAQHLGGDMADGRPESDAAFTRHDHAFTGRAAAQTRSGSNYASYSSGNRPTRAREPSFTPLNRESPSAGAQGVLYAGGVTLLAAVLAAGFTTLRPGPRRQSPNLPAPAWSQARRRR
jgi:hypothetical protein